MEASGGALFMVLLHLFISLHARIFMSVSFVHAVYVITDKKRTRTLWTVVQQYTVYWHGEEEVTHRSGHTHNNLVTNMPI